ncbi:autotransporter domain-containing protein [Xanthobacteraceae bacterium Astr-EGSB]|uniref:autotransporter domain-containing protein n=1 Tax=Astrobacterium formosum TaxID=3069710 RepID=UPI0027B23F96|nr:autotransporter domain-containing protein [Xanthobacteraceae bacterium Astr-EGSB]
MRARGFLQITHQILCFPYDRTNFSNYQIRHGVDQHLRNRSTPQTTHPRVTSRIGDGGRSMTNGQIKRWLRQTTALAATCAACALAGQAHAQTPWAITGQPAASDNWYHDVYYYVSQYDALRGLSVYATPQVTGQFTRFIALGDSLSDSHLALHNQGVTAPGASTPYNSSAVSPTGRYGNLVNIPDGIQYHYGVASSATYNYAWGGATSSTLNNNPQSWQLPGMVQEIQAVQASGMRFGWTDLISIGSAGGNDSGTSSGGAFDIRSQTATNNAANVSALMALGGRNFVLTHAGSLSANQAALAPLAEQGARIFLFDIETLKLNIAANPSRYGFASTREYCTLPGATGCPPSPGGNKTNPTISNAQLLAEDNASTTIYGHPTSSFSALIAAYEVNQVDAPATVTAQAELAQIGAQGFVNSLFGRLDAYRRVGASAYQNAYAADMPAKAKPKAIADQPWSVFLEGAYQAGKRDDTLFAFGYDYDIEGGIFGVQYQVNSNLALGFAFSGTTGKATLNQAQSHVDVDSYQFAGFLSANYPNWFVDAMVAGGLNDYKIDRPGVILGDQTADTDGHSFTFAAKAGYLFDVGAMKIGPIAGFNYNKVSIDRYQETGDLLLNQIVAEQDADSFSANAGVQLRLAQPYGSFRVDPYLNLTAEHQFTGDRTILTWQQSVQLLPIYTPIMDRGETTYGKVAAGFSAAITKQFSAQFSAVTTFARDGGDDYGVSGGMKYQF